MTTLHLPDLRCALSRVTHGLDHDREAVAASDLVEAENDDLHSGTMGEDSGTTRADSGAIESRFFPSMRLKIEGRLRRATKRSRLMLQS